MSENVSTTCCVLPAYTVLPPAYSFTSSFATFLIMLRTDLLCLCLPKLLDGVQGSAYPVYGGDEPLTPTSQVSFVSLLLCRHIKLAQQVSKRSGHLGSACSLDHQAVSQSAKMAHLPHLILKLWLVTKATSRSAQLLLVVQSPQYSIRVIILCSLFRWTASIGMPVGRAVASSWQDCLAANSLEARKAPGRHHRLLEIWCHHHQATASH